ncbi:uncharacterized protein LOC106066008 [Biomphalaria glabrata]|uniref:Uncharacterized protein LOC106066008 n=1 Tax=Biomphalaria glabrata TaxID=6526 RepID=A0A9U8EBW4_BIOGL|nr:uncharacterized protein LOC106066008 [Biomphalaria glabrata]
MSFTPRGSDGRKSGIFDPRFPPMDDCCVFNDRRCASIPFLLQVEDPPWYCCPPKCPPFRKPLIKRAEYTNLLSYDNQYEYLAPHLEDMVLPSMAFWFYCDHVPDLHDTGVKYSRILTRESERPLHTWPPLAANVCPPPRECEPCGPGPWANPALRRFFYMDCQ